MIWFLHDLSLAGTIAVATVASITQMAIASTVDLSLMSRAIDPCAVIGGQKWAAPSAVRACFESFPDNQTIKNNVSAI